MPDDLDIHLILDNYSTHKTPAIKRWLASYPCFHLHFMPTCLSWPNLVERWFGELTSHKLKRGTRRSIHELHQDNRDWMKHWNENPRPYVWTKTADQMLNTLAAYCKRITDSGY